METHSQRCDWLFLSSFRLVRRLCFPCERFWVSTNRTVCGHEVSGSEGQWFWLRVDVERFARLNCIFYGVGLSVVLGEGKHSTAATGRTNCVLCWKENLSVSSVWRADARVVHWACSSSLLQTSLYCQGVLWQYKLLRRPIGHFGEGLGQTQTAGGGERGWDVCHRFGCVAG